MVDVPEKPVNTARDVFVHANCPPCISSFAMSALGQPASTYTGPRATRIPNPPHPYRVYGYRINQEWIYKFAKDHNIGGPDISGGSRESAVFGYLINRLPGLQLHFLDDPTNIVFGYCHCLAIATNWNEKKRKLAAGRLPTWKSVLGTEEEPRWYKPTIDTIPRR